jgi:DNA invertase Pin-like site-specific DNA recombinase
VIRPNTSRAVLYARVSSKDQEREGFSIPAQTKLLESYARDHQLDIAERFIDVETAKRSGRSGFTKMVAFLRANAASCRVLLVEKTARHQGADGEELRR